MDLLKKFFGFKNWFEITIANSDMTITAFNLKKESFTPPAGAIVYYGHGESQFAFLVNDHDELHDDMITFAIRWYAVELELPFTTINQVDPRQTVKLRLVK